MGKDDGFKLWDRRSPARRPVSERIHDWREHTIDRAESVSREQGGRCMDCGVPFCQQGCPLGNLIPDWNDLVYRGDWKAAYRALSSTNNFPEFTGRLCPAPCEAACVLAINDQPVTIEHIEQEIAERAFAEGWVQPRVKEQRTGKSVGIVGSGPAGLAAAEQLNAAGHGVVVYEQADRIGGLLRYGIPDFKMEKWVIDRRLDHLQAAGIRFRTQCTVGQDVGWAELLERHDAVLIAVGAMRPRDLDVPGRDLDGVCFAMDYLQQQNRVVAGDTIPEAERIDARGKRVMILGGGDTGSDCLGTALRQRAASVTQVELMPRPPEQRTADNPWPHWPHVFTTSSSQKEGGERGFGLMTTHLDGEDGKLHRLHARRVAVESRDGRMQLVEQPGELVTHDVDLLILAMGFTGPILDSVHAELGLELTARGAVASRGFRTNIDRLWVAGDAYRGASLIVWAIADGREAARDIDAQLVGRVRLPTKGIDAAF